MNESNVKRGSLLVRFAERFGVDHQKLIAGLKATAFRKAGEISNEQLMALLVVCDQYGLNPFTREIYAYPDRDGAIIPIVSVDGWLRIINSHPQFDGLEFAEAPEQEEIDGRMLRHKVLIQGARVAFGFAGIFDEDEGQRIRDGQAIREAEVLDRAKPLVAMPRAKSEAVEAVAVLPDATEPDTDEAVHGAEVSDGD